MSAASIQAKYKKMLSKAAVIAGSADSEKVYLVTRYLNHMTLDCLVARCLPVIAPWLVAVMCR